ncbi:Pre-mRNA-splicing factor of RES complex-domain-containing protein [Lasiosphaeria ovina]|uniref:Pre-mRNA-splicing factor of RES complex-domain-containing protein n=1 Tax=Lasiosphaeria ovina TaxID=92902 RepID=A0AAE0N4E1_9PEZI|nr:Pre-mRNA-splicing factor of RES complex-domain-containing protein [Lasiosphaeria ovina]
MPSDKASYLAAHYLTADGPSSSKSKSKKRKRSSKHAGSNNDGLLIVADDDWGTSATAQNDEDDDGPATVVGTSAEFRRAKKSAWKTVGAPIPADTKDARDAAAAEADAILASAAAERREEAGTTAEDEAPAVVGGAVDNDGDVAMMRDGTHAGLQSAKAITAQLRRRQEAEREELARLNAERAAAAGDDKEEDQIVLRDATGRRVDVSMRRAEMRRAAAAAERLEEARKRALKGDVQLEQTRQRREALEDAALMPVARGKDDEEMNAELRAQQRWNDPMAEFVAASGGPGGRKKKGGAQQRRPVYQGAAPPNRYSIRPGYRWDGVDRGNGFEAERFKAINRRDRNKTLDYAWQMDE